MIDKVAQSESKNNQSYSKANNSGQVWRNAFLLQTVCWTLLLRHCSATRELLSTVAKVNEFKSIISPYSREFKRWVLFPKCLITDEEILYNIRSLRIVAWLLQLFPHVLKWSAEKCYDVITETSRNRILNGNVRPWYH